MSTIPSSEDIRRAANELFDQRVGAVTALAEITRERDRGGRGRGRARPARGHGVERRAAPRLDRSRPQGHGPIGAWPQGAGTPGRTSQTVCAGRGCQARRSVGGRGRRSMMTRRVARRQPPQSPAAVRRVTRSRLRRGRRRPRAAGWRGGRVVRRRASATLVAVAATDLGEQPVAKVDVEALHAAQRHRRRQARELEVLGLGRDRARCRGVG